MTSTPQPISPLGKTRDGFADACAAHGHSPHPARAAYTRFFRERDHDALPACAAAKIAPIVNRLDETCEEGVTTKFVQRLDRPGTGRLADQGVPHLDIESVIIPMLGRTGRKTHTLCVSSQVGCAMGCGFCETAQMGLVRSLSASEIVGQWWAARELLIEEAGGAGAPPVFETHHTPNNQTGGTPVPPSDVPPKIDNIVFMGMGEPLDNLDEVLAAVACLADHTGPGMPMSAITISTVGRVDGLRRLIDVVQQTGWKRLGLALSVNAPNDEIRDQIMPLNKKWGMGELREVMLDLVAVRGSRKILFEYVLIPGVNDAHEHAIELARWLQPFVRTQSRGHIGMLNVIPYNPRRDSPWPAPSEESVEAFVGWLRAEGIFAKRRRTKGRTQMAACGQLGAPDIRKRNYTPVTTNQTVG